MKNLILTLMLGGALVTVGGCSQAQLQAGGNNALRNLTAAQCDNQQATLSQLPLMFVTPAQAQMILAGACAALYGTEAAPTSAPGNSPVFPGPTVVPTPVPSAVPTASTSVVK